MRKLDYIFIVYFALSTAYFSWSTWANFRMHELNLDLWNAHLETRELEKELYGN